MVYAPRICNVNLWFESEAPHLHAHCLMWMLTEVTTPFPWCSLQTASPAVANPLTSIYRPGSCGAVRIDTVFRRQCRFCLPGHKCLNPEGGSSPPPWRLSIQNTVVVITSQIKRSIINFPRCCVQFFATPWTVACQAPLSMEFSRQEYCCGWPFPSPGDLPNPGIEPASPALAGRFYTDWATREAQISTNSHIMYSLQPQVK